MKLQHVATGQRFILSRTGEEFECHGRHPGRGRHVLVEPYRGGDVELKAFFISCDVELIETKKKGLFR